MRATSSRVLFAVLAAGGLTAGFITSQFAFLLVGILAALMLATSLAGAFHPVTRALLSLRGRAVDVTLWGAPPPVPPGTELVITSVNVLSAGLHVFFEASGTGSVHLKVAQPRNPEIQPGAISIASARYVQWEGRKVPPAAGATAVSIALRPE